MFIRYVSRQIKIHKQKLFAKCCIIINDYTHVIHDYTGVLECAEYKSRNYTSKCHKYPLLLSDEFLGKHWITHG